MAIESHQLEDVQTAVLAVALTNKKPDSEKYDEYKQNLVNKLQESGNNIVGEPIAFYKDGVDNPAGYVIETDKEVFVCYHGTQFGEILGSGAEEILHDLQASGAEMDFGGEKVLVHSGFREEFLLSRDSMREALSRTQAGEKGIHLSGHSLGAAVSQIAAMDLSMNLDDNFKINRVTTFGGPRVFQKEAADLYNNTGLGDVTLRVKQDVDPVPRLIPRGLFHHTGHKLVLKSEKGVHSGGVYRNMVENMQDTDLETIRASDKAWSFTEYYLEPIIQMTKDAFAKIRQGIDIAGAIKKARETLSGFIPKTESSANHSPPPVPHSPDNKKGQNR